MHLRRRRGVVDDAAQASKRVRCRLVQRAVSSFQRPARRSQCAYRVLTERGLGQVAEGRRAERGVQTSHDIKTAPQSKLREDAADMMLDRLWGDEESPSDLWVR